MSEPSQREYLRNPELARFPSPEEAQAARTKWLQTMYRRPGFWIALIGYSIVLSLVLAGTFIGLRQWIPMRNFIIGPVVGVVVGGTCSLGVCWLYRNRYRRFLRLELIAQGIPICLQCGNDLTGNTSHRCPECGTAAATADQIPQ